MSTSDHGAEYKKNRDTEEYVKHKEVLVCKRVECSSRQQRGLNTAELAAAAAGGVGDPACDGGVALMHHHPAGTGDARGAGHVCAGMQQPEERETVIGLELHEGDAVAFLEQLKRSGGAALSAAQQQQQHVGVGVGAGAAAAGAAVAAVQGGGAYGV